MGPTIELTFSTARELAAAMRAREVSSVEVVAAHLDAVERVDPAVNAMVTVLQERALAQAREADAALARGDAVGALHGLPVAIKDYTQTAGVRTTLGSPIFADWVPETDALPVERLKRAGAILIGKTNVPEFAAGSQTYNALFGATLNPYDTSRTCGGSSGGAAVALATGMAPLADGSDMGGSLRNPASYCNVVGLRPSPGRVPSWPTLAAWSPLMVSGPMARTVQDVALMLSVMAGPDDRSAIALEDPGEHFARPLERDFGGVRVAWSRDLGGVPVDSAVTAVLEAHRGVFIDMGCELVEAEPDFADADMVFKTLRAWTFELALGEHLDSNRDKLGENVVWNIEEGRRLTGPQLGAAERAHAALYHRVREFMAAHEFLLAPVVQLPPFDVTQPYPREVAGEAMHTYIDWMKSCYFISTVGLPAASVPCGFTDGGLPIGIQIIGRHRNDLAVLQLARAFEDATRYHLRRPPMCA
jgi:amidase